MSDHDKLRHTDDQYTGPEICKAFREERVYITPSKEGGFRMIIQPSMTEDTFTKPLEVGSDELERILLRSDFAPPVIETARQSLMNERDRLLGFDTNNFSRSDMKLFGEHCRMVLSKGMSEQALNAVLDTWIENRKK